MAIRKQQHKTCVKEYIEANRQVVQCTVCGIEVGFNPQERPGLDGATSLFENLPCISQERAVSRVA